MTDNEIAKIKEIAATLGWRLTSYRSTWTLTESSGLNIKVWKYSLDKLAKFAGGPVEYLDMIVDCFHSFVKPIGINLDRPATSIAADIKRRLLPKYENWRKETLAKMQKQHRVNLERREIWDLIQNSFEYSYLSEGSFNRGPNVEIGENDADLMARIGLEQWTHSNEVSIKLSAKNTMMKQLLYALAAIMPTLQKETSRAAETTREAKN